MIVNELPLTPLYKLLEPFQGKAIKVLCLGREENLDRFKKDVANIHNDFNIHAVPIAHGDGLADDEKRINSALEEHRFDIAFIVDTWVFDILDIHRITSSLKDTGCIVSTCYSRSLFYEPPDDDSPVNSLPGMFNLAGKLASMAAAMTGHKGDYLEFGVFDGRTMSLAWHTMAHHVRHPMRLFGFDSYDGIKGSLETEIFKDRDFYSNIETYHHHMRCIGADPERTIPVKGDFADTLANPAESHASLGIERCLVAHIDCDIYVPAKLALDYVTALLQQGSLLLFDDFHANRADNRLGERRALREWLEENPQFQVEKLHDYDLMCRAYVVHEV